ncbi:MAG: metal ABC transporter permease [Elusimicrobia bacterium]|nr:metal ABC transporter permease [Elusimicrobiota bacterium]MDE2236645.1 metal ABC transporter permease [Elusimicrobiota bacterium]MDE2425175.1 metal ABC transporter permease [Elusimicrobiota bacterium]
MTTLLDMLRPSFLLCHAVYGSMVVGFVVPLVGSYFLLRRLVFWGVALPEVSAAGISCAFMLQGLGFTLLAGGESGQKHLAILGSVVFTVAAIVFLAYTEQRGGVPEGRVGSLYALAGALAILFLVWNPGGEAEMLGLLKGEIVTISGHDFRAMLEVFGLVTAAMFVFQREFTLVSYDRDMAVTLGRNVLVWDGLLFLIVGITVSLGVMTAGPLVIFGFLVIPPMAALPWARGMLSFCLLASLVGGFCALGGFYLSFTRDLPLGPVIVCLACAVLLVSSALRKLLRKAGC